MCSRVGLLDLVTAESGSDSRKKQSIPIHSCQSIGQSSDEGGDPLGPTKEIGALMSLKVEVDLLKDVLGLEGDHARGPGERH